MTMNRRTLLGASASISAAAMLAACSGSEPAAKTADDPTGASDAGGSAGQFPVTVTHKFGETTVEGPSDPAAGLQVVALGWSDAEVCLALGVKPAAVYDWLGTGEDNKGVGPWAASLFGDATPEVIARSDAGIDYELVASLSPDVILNVNSGYDEAEYRRLAEIAPTISGPVDAANFAPGWDNQTLLVAEALGLKAEGEKLVEDTRAKLAAVKDENPEFQGVQAVTGSKFGEAYGLHLKGDFRWDGLEAFGFVLGEEASKVDANGGFYADIPAEKVSVFDTEVAVFFPIGLSLEEMKADPLLASLNVVKDGRAVFLDPEDTLVNAFSAGSALSVAHVCEKLPPLLKDAVAKL